MTVPYLLGPWGRIRVGMHGKPASRDEVLARHLGGSGAQAVADLLDVPEHCMVFSPPGTAFIIVTDRDHALGAFDPVLQFLFYKPLSEEIGYYLCLYDWTMSAHIMLADARRRVAVNAVYNVWTSDRGTDWSRFRASVTDAAAIAAADAGLRFGRVGFGGGRFRESAQRLERIPGAAPAKRPADDRVFFTTLGQQLYAAYYLGFAPFIPEIAKIFHVKSGDGSQHLMFARDDTHVSGAFDWSEDLRDPMNPYRQGLIDLFGFMGIAPDEAQRGDVRAAFRDKVIERGPHATETAELLRKSQEENPSQSDSAAEKYLARAAQDPDMVFDALYPAELLRVPGGALLRQIAARYDSPNSGAGLPAPRGSVARPQPAPTVHRGPHGAPAISKPQQDILPAGAPLRHPTMGDDESVQQARHSADAAQALMQKELEFLDHEKKRIDELVLARKEAATKGRGRPGANNTILIVDDDVLYANDLSVALSKHGLRGEITNGAMALDSARRVRPCLLIVGAELHGTSGYTICNRVKGDPELGTTPLFLIAAEEAQQQNFEQHRNLRRPADDYAIKPTDPAELVPRALELVARSRFGSLQSAVGAEAKIEALEGLLALAEGAPPPAPTVQRVVEPAHQSRVASQQGIAAYPPANKPGWRAAIGAVAVLVVSGIHLMTRLPLFVTFPVLSMLLLAVLLLFATPADLDAASKPAALTLRLGAAALALDAGSRLAVLLIGPDWDLGVVLGSLLQASFWASFGIAAWQLVARTKRSGGMP
ncbi:MAG: response regulator [Polyangiaceae bacterium]